MASWPEDDGPEDEKLVTGLVCRLPVDEAGNMMVQKRKIESLVRDKEEYNHHYASRDL
jgi:hypothetical protein